MSFSVPAISSPGTSDTKTSVKPKMNTPPAISHLKEVLKENPAITYVENLIENILQEPKGKHCLLYLYDLHRENPDLVTIDQINDASTQIWHYQEVKDDYYLRMMKWDLSGWDEWLDQTWIFFHF